MSFFLKLRGKLNEIFLLSLSILAVLFCSFGCSGGSNSPPPQNAPDFTLKDLAGNDVSLSNFQGKAIILNFWATWCPPCRAEIPHFIKLYEEYKDKGLVIIGISLDQGVDTVIKDFVAKYNITYPILRGNKEVIASYGGMAGIPTTFFINREGKIVNKIMGIIDERTTRKNIEKILGTYSSSHY